MGAGSVKSADVISKDEPVSLNTQTSVQVFGFTEFSDIMGDDIVLGRICILSDDTDGFVSCGSPTVPVF
jgi:hypothetical protein